MIPFKNADSITEAPLPTAMIDGFRRRFGRSIDEDPWDAEQALKPEAPGVGELSTDGSVLLAAAPSSGEFAPSDENIDFYKRLVITAIENGGRLGGHEISVPWLRMILAGLEMRPIEPEAMWYGVDAARAGSGPQPPVPLYDDLFPGEGDIASRS